jgi:hypothetical protein
MQQQLVDFKNSQAGVLTLEEFVKTDNTEIFGLVSFKLVNRGNSLVRIRDRKGEYWGKPAERAPDWSQIRKRVEAPLEPDPNGELIPAGLSKTYQFNIGNYAKVQTHEEDYAFWYTWSYLDVFNRPHLYSKCFYYIVYHAGYFVPCSDEWNRQGENKKQIRHR